MKVCFATNNAHKLHEIQLLLGEKFEVLSLSDIGCEEELPETRDTLEGNSLQKAQYVWDQYQVNCFADDTGLEVAALDGEPGVYSARYAGPQRNNQDNIQLVLQKLSDKPDRSAQFKTIITLILNGEVNQFEGIVKGRIINELRGTAGFGYDAVFMPDGCDRTFAQMETTEKGAISHRGRAVEKLVAFLTNQA